MNNSHKDSQKYKRESLIISLILISVAILLGSMYYSATKTKEERMKAYYEKKGKKEIGEKRLAKKECKKIANDIKWLRYTTAHNDNDQHQYELDRWRTEEQIKKFELKKCDNSLLIDNSWNPLTDGTIKR